MKRKVAVAGLAMTLAAATLAGTAYADGPDVIQTRKAGQDLLAGDFAGIRAVVMLKGDLKTLQRPAAALARWMTLFPSMFPPGSDKGNTKALPVVWSNPAGFQKDANDLVEAANKLAAAAKAGDAAAVATQINAINDSCDACHHEFRAR